jgi:ligand-binding sensor domain-containing protein/DNA-binding CsgD family transcriptional regulator
MRKYLFTLLISLASICKGQNTIGLPDIVNFKKINYKAGLQNWDFKQDKKGILYVANNEGVLCFDGRNWKLVPLPNRTIVRSIEIDEQEHIYVGGQGELGYFKAAPTGTLQYYSLIDKIPAQDRNFGDVWDIISSPQAVFFRCSNKIFVLKNDQINSFRPDGEWAYMGTANGKVYAHDFETGIKVYNKGIWTSLAYTTNFSKTDPITAILPIGKDSALITTLKSGIYLMNETSIQPQRSVNQLSFCKARIYAATPLEKNRFALATSNNGVFIIDKEGNIIQRFTKQEGIQQNNVLSIFCDHQQNLWLGLDNGIDLIAYNSAIKHITPSNDDGAGYGIAWLNNQLYIGTSNGIYYTPLQTIQDKSFSIGSFQKVKNSDGQVWNLSVINNQLLAAHHDGGYRIEQGQAQLFNTQPGNWNFIPFTAADGKARLAIGHYQGITLYAADQSHFKETEQIKDFEESSRYIVADLQNNLWISHPYHGVFKCYRQDSIYKIKKYTEKEGIPTPLNNQVYLIDKKVTLATEKGVYYWNDSSNQFVPHPFFQSILGNKGIRYLTADKANNYWFVQDKTVGVINGKSKSITYLPELSNKILSGFEYILPVDEDNIFISAERGIFHVNFKKYKENIKPLQVEIRNISIYNNRDSLIYGGFGKVAEKGSLSENLIIPSSWKTIRLSFSSILFGEQSRLEYTYRLKGFDNTWSDWSDKTDKEYTNVREGKYVFEVIARNNLGNESSVTSFSFEVLPPWYRTLWAYAFYFGALGAVFIFMYQLQNRKFIRQKEHLEEENKQLLYIHELEINKTNTELVALRNEKLEAEINFKNGELASSTMHLVKKGELLTKIKEELSHVLKYLDNKTAIQELKKVIKSVSDEDKIDQEWETFAKHFDTVHSDFVVTLNKIYPNLTANEVKLCIYLRMNLSSKEIAQLMSISVRGVEISRYRLRKKIGISSETNLYNHLMSLDSKE